MESWVGPHGGKHLSTLSNAVHVDEAIVGIVGGILGVATLLDMPSNYIKLKSLRGRGYGWTCGRNHFISFH